MPGARCAPYAVTWWPAAPTRQASVAAALAAVPAGFAIVLVHDAARALAPAGLVERGRRGGAGRHGAVIPVLPVVDTIKQVDAPARCSARSTGRRCAAGADAAGLPARRARAPPTRPAVDEHTDDAGMAEKLGVPVTTVPGEEAALKITRPFDLALAEFLTNR